MSWQNSKYYVVGHQFLSWLGSFKDFHTSLKQYLHFTGLLMKLDGIPIDAIL
jgi:activator of HSP90 ATPase